MIEVIVDSIRVSIPKVKRVVVLKEKAGEMYLLIWIGSLEPDIISNGLLGVSSRRPLTFDFVYSIIEGLRAVLKSVVITELKNETFYAKACFESGEKNIEIECRPSDGIGLALRTGAKIFVAKTVMDKAGVKITELNDSEMKTIWSVV